MALKHELRANQRAEQPRLARSIKRLLDWKLGAVIALCSLALLLVAQAPFAYSFTAGIERGDGSDLPFLDGFNPPEANTTDTWRWSQGAATIEMPGVGQRGAVASFEILSHQGQFSSQPATMQIYAGSEPPATVTLRRERAHYHVYVPPQAIPDGTLRLHLNTAPWQQPNDRRTLGVALGNQFSVQSVNNAGVVLPDLALWLGWPLGLGLCWLALGVVGFRPPGWLVLPWALMVPLVALLQAPRLGFGGQWIVEAGLLAVVYAALCRWLVPPLLERAGARPAAWVMRWLLLLMAAAFVLKYGARLYPDSMPGDIGLHDNRFQLTITGHVFIQAQHRGLPFPFPPGLYLLVAPFTTLGIPVRVTFQVLAGLFESSTVLLLYLLLVRAGGSARLGLLAAAVYSVTAGGFMTTWFSFQTHVATQWFAIALTLLLVWRWPRYHDWPTWALLVMLLVQVFLGHIGLFINTALLGVLLVPVLWWRARSAAERRAARDIGTAGLAAAVFSALFYYGAFAQLGLEQVIGTANEGLNGVTGKTPIPRAVSLDALWRGGLITHFGFFPVALAAAGALLLSMRYGRRTVLVPLLWLTFLVSASQAVLPFITLSSITTRWLMFSVWGIAVAGAVGFQALWWRGRMARVVGLAMLGYVVWITLTVWINAAFLRLPPIEPF